MNTQNLNTLLKTENAEAKVAGELPNAVPYLNRFYFPEWYEELPFASSNSYRNRKQNVRNKYPA